MSEPGYHNERRRGVIDPIVMRSGVLIACVVLLGTAGYTWIEGWSPWRSLFFTLVTLTTVGYGDYGLSEAGERFTAVLMIGGIGTVSYTATSAVHRVMVRATHPERQMLEKIKKMSGHTIVCGLGRTGERVIDRLRREGAEVVAIDNDPKKVESSRERGLIALEGDASGDAALEDAGALRAAAVAAVTSSDAVNALICLSAGAIAPGLRVIARAEDESSIRKLERAGAASVLSPSVYGGDGIAEQLLRPEAAKLMPGLQGDGGVQFSEMLIGEHSVFAGRTIASVGREHPRMVIIAAGCAGGDLTVRPESDRVLQAGDVLVVAGAGAEMDALRDTARAA